MPGVPEFMLRKLIVKDSIVVKEDQFSFALLNSLVPATLLGFSLEVEGQAVPPDQITLQAGEGKPISGDQVSPENPFSLAVGVRISVTVKGVPFGDGDLRFVFVTREAGQLSFGLKSGRTETKTRRKTAPSPRRKLFQRPNKTEVVIRADDVIDEIDPNIYGHFVEHLERCVYDGIWTADGSALRQDTLEHIKTLKPANIRYPGGNFVSGYQWEDGVGHKETRPERFDEAWQVMESNQVGTDEFMVFCKEIGAEPFMVVNAGNGTPEEAARWVAYCNEPADGEQGKRRAANGHPQPYGVKLWGVGNEVWSPWQIGHTDAEKYTRSYIAFAEAMRAVDPTIQLVAVGDKVLTDNQDDPGRLWNETLLRGAGGLIDYLSFHLYQPDRDGWEEEYDEDFLHHVVCAAPLGAEKIIERIAAQIAEHSPEKEIGIAFDEWNLLLPPPEGAETMHQTLFSMRDALYVAGMLNAFQRKCQVLKIGNLSQLVNVLPLIITGEKGAFVTPIYHPFVMYQQMEKLALKTDVRGKYYDIEQLGTIAEMQDVPYVDVAATRNPESSRLVLGIVNRHPTNRAFVDIDLKGFEKMKLSDGWLLRHDDLLATNSFEEPENVTPKRVPMPDKRGSRFKLDLPQGSVSILILEKIED